MLKILSRYHDMFVGYVLGFGVNPDTAQDIVQEFYLKMHDYKKDIMIGEEINFYFVYLVLRNMVFDLKKKEKRFYFTDEIPSLQDEEYTDIDTTKSEFITQWLNSNNIENLNLENINDLKKIYHACVFNEVMLENKSIAELSRETTISYPSLYNTIRIIKNEIKENYEAWNKTREDI
jgi:DNA-directed RNA polymerase specialized sigma24 family protein